jgi:hypothetical protein
VIRLPDCRPRGLGFDSRRCQIFWIAVGLEQGPLSPCEDEWGATWKEVASVKKLRLTTVGNPPIWPRDTPLSAKVGTKFHQQVAVAQSVYFACGLKRPRSLFFVCLFVYVDGRTSQETLRASRVCYGDSFMFLYVDGRTSQEIHPRALATCYGDSFILFTNSITNRAGLGNWD